MLLYKNSPLKMKGSAQVGVELRNGQTINLSEQEVREIEARALAACRDDWSMFKHLSYCCSNSPAITNPHNARAFAQADLLQDPPPITDKYVAVTFKPEVIAVVAAMTQKNVMSPVDPIKK